MATILLLALTVVLFSSIFYFVTTFPPPPAQNSNQFQAQIIQTGNASSPGTTMALGISILHLAGPTVPASALIYLKSSVYPLGPEFSSPYTVADGGITSSVWALGQTWYLTAFAGHCTTNPNDYCNPILPDNITVYILSGSSLLFTAIIPGSVANTPPTYLSTATTPGIVAIGEGFTVSTVISGVTSSNTVTINESKLPGGRLPTKPVAMNYSASTNEWTTYINAGATNESGTYYAYISASNTAGKTAVTPVPVSITPYSTLIGSAVTVGTASYMACTGVGKPYAACQASADKAYSVTISASSVTFGSVLFEVYTTATGTAYATTTHSAFAIALSSAATTPLLTFVGPATGPMLISSSTWSTTYASPTTSTTALTSSYVFSMDIGTGTAVGAGVLSFIVIGNGAYSSSTTALSLPAS